MSKINLTDFEKESILQGIEEAERRLSYYPGEITDEEARLLLKETLFEPFCEVLRNHKSERKLT